MSYYLVSKKGTGEILQILDSTETLQKFLNESKFDCVIEGFGTLADLNASLVEVGLESESSDFCDDLRNSVAQTTKTVLGHVQNLSGVVREKLSAHAEFIKTHVNKFTEDARAALHEKTKPADKPADKSCPAQGKMTSAELSHLNEPEHKCCRHEDQSE